MTTEIIGIDGPAGSGKSTVTRAVARELGWTYLDTGAMYRAVTVGALRAGISLEDGAALGSYASAVTISLFPRVTIDDVDVSDDLRLPTTNEGVSVVASNAQVRECMVEVQRAMAAASEVGVVVEGRDITTVVFPAASVKIFLTASLEERARRRGDESSESVERRDNADSSRAVSPLRQADDAIVIDTTGRSIDDVVKEIVAWHTSTTSN